MSPTCDAKPWGLLWRLPGMLAVLALLGGCRTVSPVRVSPYAEELRFSGRVDRADEDGPRLAWSGTALTVRFTGTSIGLRLVDLPKLREPSPNRYRVSVDGQPFHDLYVSQQRVLYRVAEGLPEGEHVLRLEKETEAMVGGSQLLGLELDPGARLLPAPPEPSRRLEFIGDSGLTGFGIEGRNEKCSFSAETQRSSLTWPALTARALEAEPFILAFSGKGVTINYDDDPSPTMVQLYERTLPSVKDSRWDFQAWAPDAVIIQLGSNDFWKQHPGITRFRSAYQELVRSIRARYPRAHIVCLLGPGLSDGWPKGIHARASARALLSDLVTALRQDGDERVHYVEVPPRQREEGLGCSWHPSQKTHQRVAEQMTEVLRELLGWE